MTGDIHFREATEVGGLIRSRKLSPVEATRAMLARIKAVDPKLHSYARLTEELALAQAEKAEAEVMSGRIRGPLHGVPIAVKDNCYTEGIVSANGQAILSDFRPSYDATVVVK